MAINVTIWNENVHEKTSPEVQAIYPDGLHNAIAKGIACDDFNIKVATLDMPECGLDEKTLNETDVLFWWGHAAHGQVPDDLVERIYRRVLDGMGLIVLHSGHHSKIFTKLMGTPCNLRWREAGERCRVWTVNPNHPITQGVPPMFTVEHDEMYGEPFVIPDPDELIFISWFKGGEVFRSGCTYHRGCGRIFYFQNGHETYPVYYNEDVLKVLSNATRWAYNPNGRYLDCNWYAPLEKLDEEE